ncbi:MAG: S8 family serine peptidase [Saprospiraceae bacterium]
MRILSLFLVFVLLTSWLNAQDFVNKEWVKEYGSPENIDWSSTTFDGSGNLIHVGNTALSSTNTDLLITKYTPEGDAIWERQYGGIFNGKDYGIAVIADAADYIYVAGVITTATNQLDFCLLKYDENGDLLWQTTWNGLAALDDIPSALSFDNSGNIVVAGGTFMPNNQSDYFILKYNNSGTLLWQYLYDYAGFYDFPTDIQIESNNNILVTGASATAQQTWDYATVRVNGTTGLKITENRINVPGIGLDNALALTQDDIGNIYITGYTDNTGNRNIQTVKLDAALNLVWVKDFDGAGLEDVAEAIGVDYLGNVYVSGYSEKLNGGSDLVTIKYDANGQDVWIQRYTAEDETKEVQSANMVVSSLGDLYIIGTVEGANGKDFVAVEYNTNGKLNLEKKYDNTTSGDDEAKSIILDDDGNLYVSGTSELGTTTKYTTVKYGKFEKTNSIIYENGEPSHKSNDLVVKFLPQHVNLNFVDNKELQYGTIENALPQNVKQAIENAVGTNLNEIVVLKPFYRMTSNEQFSTSRLGETVPIPEFWSTFTFHFPDNFNIKDVQNIFNDDLNEYVEYAHYNFVAQAQTIPNDPLYNTNQASLHSTTAFPNAHINLEPAWDIETGEDYIKVGVYDSHIFWGHEDFGDGTFAGSNIVGGWNYSPPGGTNIQSITNPDILHGTHVAGIIGANRDNATGITGIAGGGFDAQGNDNPGVELFSMAIEFWNDKDNDGVIDPPTIQDLQGEKVFVDNATIAAAIVEGAVFTPIFGYGLHIQNHSWASLGFSTTIRRAVRTAYRNQCIVVASRGNNAGNGLQYPACYDDRFVMSVGGSGIDGEYFNGTNGELDAVGNPNPNNNGFSFGGNVDFIAPGVRELVATATDASNTLDASDWTDANGTDLCGITDANYTCFNGTSASAPHVAGVAALMCSRHHPNKGTGVSNPLAPEDVERILQSTATDIVNPNSTPVYPIGYDDRNGAGRINAGAALQMVDNPTWEVFHSGNPTATQQNTVNNTFQVYLDGSVAGLPAGWYFADQRVDVTHTYQNFFPNKQIVTGWGRQSSTVGYSMSNMVNGDMFQGLNMVLTPNIASVIATTSAWHLYLTYGAQQIDVWIPDHPSNLKTAYSLHLFDQNATSTENIEDNNLITVFPNPAGDYTRITYALPNVEKATLQVYNLTGQLITEQQLQPTQQKTIELNTSNWSSGIYFIQIQTEEHKLTKKLVKY